MLGYLPLYFVRGQGLFSHSECLLYHLSLHVDDFESFLGEWQFVDRPTAHLQFLNLSYNLMSNSPYPPSDVKDYLRKHELEQLMNNTINDLLRSMPEDPYAYIIGQLQKKAAPSVEIVDLTAIEVISGEGFPALKMKLIVNYLSKELEVTINQPLSILSDENMLYDEDRLGGKGLNKSITFLKEKLANKVKGFKCEQQEDIDRQIQKALTDNGGQGIYTVNSVSYAAVLARSQVLCIPPYQIFSQLANHKGERNIQCMVNCLHGGKAIGSKCKVFKYFLVAKKVTDPTLLQTVLQAVRKAIVSGKGGQAALKMSPDGTYICPLDTINDNLKIVQDAITSSGGKQSLGIGLSWQADTLFAADTKKYESQNPKAPFDNDQFIDYHVKMLTDKPLICYLEDPLATSEKAAWKKLITKIRETDAIKHVKVGSRQGGLLNLTSSDLKTAVNELSVEQNEESHPDISAEQRQTNNGLKFCLDYVQVRAFELKTVSNVVKIYKELRRVKTGLILQDCSLQTYDSTLIDLAFGLDCFSCLGSIGKFDRVSKLNRMRQLLDCKKQE